MAFFTFGRPSLFDSVSPYLVRRPNFTQYCSPWEGLVEVMEDDSDRAWLPWRHSMRDNNWGSQLTARRSCQDKGRGSRRGSPLKTSSKKSDKEERSWSVSLDMSGYSPENISVKQTGDHQLEVCGIYEKTHPLFGKMEISESRDVKIPSDVDLDCVRTLFTENERLIVTGPREPRKSLAAPYEVPIAKDLAISMSTDPTRPSTSEAKEEIMDDGNDTDHMEEDCPPNERNTDEQSVEKCTAEEHMNEHIDVTSIEDEEKDEEDKKCDDDDDGDVKNGTTTNAEINSSHSNSSEKLADSSGEHREDKTGNPTDGATSDTDVTEPQEDISTYVETLKKKTAHIENSLEKKQVEDTTPTSYIDNPLIVEVDGARKFLVQFNLREYAPENITVKLRGDMLRVDAIREEEADDHVTVTEFHRALKVPAGVDTDSLASQLSDDHRLTVTAPMISLEGNTERTIPIGQ